MQNATNPQRIKNRRCQRLASLAIASISLTACSAPAPKDNAPYELTGTVMDSVTKQPIEGAYVLVAYYGGGGTGFGHNSRWCQKTAGMYTKADGKYRFPATASNSVTANMPISVPTAIKPGYGNVTWIVTNDVDQNGKRKLWLIGQNLLLTPQDSAKPDLGFRVGEADCWRAKSRQDAAAGAEFLKIRLDEFTKHGFGSEHTGRMREAIKDLQELPDLSPASK